MEEVKYRKLGTNGFEVSEIGYGAWGVGQGEQWKGTDDQEAVSSMRRAIELGLNFIDTALAYGDGHSEKLVGRAVKESGAPARIATKVPPMNRRWPAQPGIGIEQVFPYHHILESTEQSLRHLGVEVIDLQQLHVWNPEWIARDEWRRAFEHLKKSGKVRAVGISINDHQPDSALDIVATGLVDSVQVIYNIFDQSPERNLFPACRRHGVGVIARVPFDEGALTGAVQEGTHFEASEFRAWYFRGDRRKQVREHVEPLEQALAGLPGTLAEKALRFCISAPDVSTVIPGMRKLRNVESSLGVSHSGPLDAATLALLKHHAWDKNFYQ